MAVTILVILALTWAIYAPALPFVGIGIIVVLVGPIVWRGIVSRHRMSKY